MPRGHQRGTSDIWAGPGSTPGLTSATRSRRGLWRAVTATGGRSPERVLFLGPFVKMGSRKPDRYRELVGSQGL